MAIPMTHAQLISKQFRSIKKKTLITMKSILLLLKEENKIKSDFIVNMGSR